MKIFDYRLFSIEDISGTVIAIYLKVGPHVDQQIINDAKKIYQNEKNRPQIISLNKNFYGEERTNVNRKLLTKYEFIHKKAFEVISNKPHPEYCIFANSKLIS